MGFGAASLTQTVNTGDFMRSLAVLAGCFILMGIILGVLRLYLLRRNNNHDSPITPGFSLRDLERMRDSGELDEDEYVAMKTQLTNRFRQTHADPPSDHEMDHR